MSNDETEMVVNVCTIRSTIGHSEELVLQQSWHDNIPNAVIQGWTFSVSNNLKPGNLLLLHLLKRHGIKKYPEVMPYLKDHTLDVRIVTDEERGSFFCLNWASFFVPSCITKWEL